MTDQNQLLREALQDIEQAHDLSLDLDHYAGRQVLVSLADKIKVALAQPAPGVPTLSKDQIREVFLSHGFTIKEGQTDLKPYVYDAADALLKLAYAALATQPAEGGVVAWMHWLHGPVRVFMNKDEAMLELHRLNSEYPADSGDRKMRPLIYADTSPASQEQADEEDDKWRDVALRFDRHRMQALWHHSLHLKQGVVMAPNGAEYQLRDGDIAHPRAARLFEAMFDALNKPKPVLPGNHYGGVALWLGNEQVVLFITEPEARGASDIKAMLEGYTKRAVFEMTRDTQG